jgi:hypothetical protein
MGETSSTIAMEYHKALRTEIVARFQMRDQILIAYLGASGALLGYGLQKIDPNNARNFLPYLLILLPFLSLGAISMVAQHQDQITAYYQYFCTEMRSSLSEVDQKVAMFYMSKAAQENTRHNLRILFVSQLLIMCGPPVLVILLNAPYPSRPWNEKTSLLVAAVLLTALTVWRTLASMLYRSSVMSRLFALRQSE